MLLDNEIKIGEVYAYDIEHNLSSLHMGTYTVKLIDIQPDGLLLVESVETGELFMCGKHTLTSLGRIKRMIKGYENVNYEELEDYEKWLYDKRIKRMRNAITSSIVNNIIDEN